MICFQSIYNITRKKSTYKKMEDFFIQQENFDVLFFGSSHVLYSVFPMQLWNDYGIISYNMAQESSTLAVSYHNLILACQETKPELIVIDTYRIMLEDKIYRPNLSNSMHNTFDPYKLSYKKYNAIKDLCGKDNLLENCMEYLFDFSIYHSRWNNITEDDFKVNKLYEKGAEIKTSIATPNETSKFDSIKIYEGEESINVQYLKKIIRYCKENNIEVLVTYLPYPASDNDIAASKYVQTICDEYNVKYINFLNLNVVNYNTDCYDTDSHLNASGARKVTDYLGKYVVENFDILDQRKNLEYDSWFEDYNDYIDFKINNMKNNRTNLNNYLILLYGESDIKYEIEISSKKEIVKGSRLEKLLENLNNNYIINDDAFVEHQDKTIKITTYDNRNNNLIETVWF